MTGSGDALERPADRSTIQELYKSGLLGPDARAAALRWLFPPEGWWAWASRLLLFSGAGLVLAGIICFFAYNWAAMGAFAKFGALESALLVCLLAAWFSGLGSLASKVLLLAACVLLGVFLAVFGQVYQTGADAFELFRGWFVLALPWTVFARFGALWILWLALVETTIILFWDQVMIPEREPEGLMFVLLALLTALPLAARELGVRRGAPHGERPAPRVAAAPAAPLVSGDSVASASLLGRGETPRVRPFLRVYLSSLLRLEAGSRERAISTGVSTFSSDRITSRDTSVLGRATPETTMRRTTSPRRTTPPCRPRHRLDAAPG